MRASVRWLIPVLAGLALSPGLACADIAPPEKPLPRPSEPHSYLTEVIERGYVPGIIVGGLLLVGTVVLPIALRKSRYWWTAIPVCLVAYVAVNAIAVRMVEAERQQVQSEKDTARERRRTQPRLGTGSVRPVPTVPLGTGTSSRPE